MQTKMNFKWFLLLLSFTIAKSDFSHVNLLQYKAFTIPDIDTICSFFPTATNVSEKCGQQLEIVCRNATLLMTMADASSKFPYSGLGFETRMDYGNFDQCMTIDHKYKEGRILGEYCLAGLNIPDLITDNGTHAEDPDRFFKLAVCRPNGCSAEDFNAILEDVLSMPLPLFLDVSCQTIESNTTWTAGDIATLTVFLVVIGLMVISTTYDIYLYKKEKKSSHPLLVCFSVLTNGRKLLHISKHSTSKEQIEVFHGFRVISMMWIVAGHGLSMYAYSPVTNTPKVAEWQQSMYGLYITTAPLAVDTFFFMSGFLLAFQYFKGQSRTFREQVIAIPKVIVHRYLRLTPALVMIYLVTITLFIHLGSGPTWEQFSEMFSSVCKTNWWKFFLYIQNYAQDMMDICLIQTWYLSADMQLFILAPIVLIPLSLQLKKFKFHQVMVEILIFYFLWMCILTGTKFIFRDDTNTYDTQTKFLNYFFGIWMGLFMRVKINEPFLYIVNETRRSVVNLVAWIVVILGLIALGVCYQDVQLHGGFISKTVFNIDMRPGYSIALSWITYSCYHGHGGFVNWILCRPIFQVLGRLTYCIYLTHGSVIMYYLGTSRTRWYFSDYNGFYLFCGHYVVSVIVATFWTLAFESPLLAVEKHFLGGARQPIERKPENGSNIAGPSTIPA